MSDPSKATSSRPALVLGSTSRYRSELLQRLGLPFEAVAPNVDETPAPNELPRDLAVRLALALVPVSALALVRESVIETPR